MGYNGVTTNLLTFYQLSGTSKYSPKVALNTVFVSCFSHLYIYCWRPCGLRRLKKDSVLTCGAQTNTNVWTKLHLQDIQIKHTGEAVKKNKCTDLDCQKHPDCFREHNRGRPGPSKCVQGGPLPVVSRVITPLIGVITPVTTYKAI